MLLKPECHFGENLARLVEMGRRWTLLPPSSQLLGDDGVDEPSRDPTAIG